MANDIDLWQDITLLENEGKMKEAESLHEIYKYKYIEYDNHKLEQAKDKHWKKYGYEPNI